MNPRLPIIIITALLFALLAGALLDDSSLTSGGITYAQTADTPTATPTPDDEQPDDDSHKPAVEESDPEGKPPVEPVVDEPRTDQSRPSNSTQSTADPASSHTQDYDADNDGLIEISNIEQLNAVRWDLNGTGITDDSSDVRHFNSAFPNAAAGMGCPSSGCRGYELTRNLDFNSPSSYASRSVNTSWTQGDGWLQIGYTDPASSPDNFDAVFDGNNYTISNLYSDNELDYQGLFVATSSLARIVRVGLIDIDLTLNYGFEPWGGGLVAVNAGLIAHSYATGSVITEEPGHNVGGLVGLNYGVITYSHADVDVTDIGGYETGGLTGDNHAVIVSSYSTGRVTGDDEVGGLVGDNEGAGIIYSYATGSVTGNGQVGALVGDNSGSLIRSSYWNTQTSGRSNGVGTGPSIGIEGKTTAELRSPTWYHGIYSDWHHAGDVWDFGTSTQYPTLKSGLDLALDICDQSISAIGRVGIIGEWADDCHSTNELGSYARYYTFTLDSASVVTINLMSNEDTYLYLLDGAGRGGRVIEPDDDGGYATDSRITRSLPRGTYTIEATTFSSRTLGYFGLILDGVPLTTPPPPFTLSRSVSDSSVEVGESFDVTLRMHDVSGAGEHGGISVSFPALTTDASDSVQGNLYSSAVADVERVSYTSGLSRVAFHKPGEDTIYHRQNNRRFTARDLMVESDDPSWSQSADRTLVLRITPNREGEFRMLVRGWICADEYTNCSRRPSGGGMPDQQGWHTYELTVSVVAPTRVESPQFDMDVEVSRANASVSSIDLGESITLNVQIHNVQGSGAHGGVSVSFPQLTAEAEDFVDGNLYSSTAADVEKVSYTNGLSRVTFHKPGEDMIYHRERNRQFTARDLLVESDDPSWSQDADRTLELHITPKEAGEFRIYVRGWICANEYSNCSSQPSSGGTLDQQGWPVREFTINVLASAIPVPTLPDVEPALRATLESCGVGDRDPHMGFYQPGDIVRLSARAANNTASDQQILSRRENLYVIFKFWGSSGILGETVAETVEVTSAGTFAGGQGESYEFAIRVPADEANFLPEGTTALQCLLYFDGESADVLEDFSGRNLGADNGYIYIDDDPVHAERLKSASISDGNSGGWTVDVSISPPMANLTEIRTMTITVERQGKLDPSVIGPERPRDKTLEQFITLSLKVPETVWVDYEAITKWVANTDGAYTAYTDEEEAYDQDEIESAIADAILAFVPGVDELHAVISSFVSILDARNNETPIARTNFDNCQDNVDVVTITPSVSLQSSPPSYPQTTLVGTEYSPKRLQVAIPMRSLVSDDHISLTVLPSDDVSPSGGMVYLQTLTDLFETNDSPSCTPSEIGTGPPTPMPPPRPSADACTEAIGDGAAIERSWTTNCISTESARDGAYARFYTFTLDRNADVTITTQSSVDSYLYLREGTGRGTSLLCKNDDYGNQVEDASCDNIGFDLASDYDSGLIASLDPGEYSIEVTAYERGNTGDFRLNLDF